MMRVERKLTKLLWFGVRGSGETRGEDAQTGMEERDTLVERSERVNRNQTVVWNNCLERIQAQTENCVVFTPASCSDLCPLCIYD